MICQALDHQNHLLLNALLFFSSYLLPPTLQAHHLPSICQLGTKPPCRCGSNVLGRPPRSPHCRCIWWRSAHSWGSPSQHLHPDLRHPGQMGRKWGWTDELKKTTMKHWIYRGRPNFQPDLITDRDIPDLQLDLWPDPRSQLMAEGPA